MLYERKMFDGPVRGRPADRSIDNPLALRLSGLSVTVDTLVADNRNAREEINKWIERKNDGNLFVVYGCSDSRVLRIFPGDHSVMVPSIAAAGHNDYQTTMRHKGKVIATHWPCGGAKAKADEEAIPLPGLKDYVKTQIKYANPVHQALEEAREAAKHSDEPVMAVVVDQENLRIIPIAIIQNKTEKSSTKKVETINSDLLNFNHLTQSLDELPALKPNQLGVFKEYLDKCAEHKQEFLDKLEGLTEAQKNQNPPVLVIDTEDQPPLSIRYPGTLSEPGSAFRISVEGDGSMQSSLNYIPSVLDQAEYPLANFDNLSTVVFQTPDIRTSERLAREFLKRDLGREWFEKDGRQIIIIGGKDGKIEKIGTMPKKPKIRRVVSD